MKNKKMNLNINGRQFVMVVVSAPEGLSKEDSYSEVFFEDPEKGWIHGVFFCYPTDPPSKHWNAPVEWTDGAMLYVPDLEDASILEAVKYLYTRDVMSETFESCSEPDEILPTFSPIPPSAKKSLSDRIDASIKQSIFGVFVQFKQLGLARTKAELMQLLLEYGEKVIDSSMTDDGQ